MDRITDSNAVIVGATGPIGPAITKRLAEEGAYVDLVDVNAAGLQEVAAEIKIDRERVGIHPVDLASGESIRNAFNAIFAKRGAIDILVVASWGHRFSLVEELDEEDWRSDIEGNLSVTYRSIRAVVPFMKKQAAGHIVTISSTAKDGVPWFASRGHSAHAAARGGVVGMTRALSYELGPHGINVNCVVVGPLRNPQADGVFSALKTDGAVRVQPEDMIALRRLGSPSDVAHAVLFLASAESDYITGASLYVSGGLYG